MMGPEDSLYAGGVYFIEVNFPQDYPFKQPKIKFATKIYHPQIFETGEICACCFRCVFKEEWHPAHTVRRLMDQLFEVLKETEAEYYSNQNIGKLIA